MPRSSARRTSLSASGLHPGPRGWRFAPEGAAVHLGQRLAVIADVHLGYEWARAAGGDVVPPHSLRETLTRLESLFARVTIQRLVIAGDLVEPFGPCPRTARDLQALRAWLDTQGVELTPLKGDHDRAFDWPETLAAAGWTIVHGSRRTDFPRVVHGHLHPVLRAEGRAFPCFLTRPDRIVLPAFSGNAAGLDIGRAALPEEFEGGALRCLVPADGEWLDFGTLRALRAKLAGGWL